MQQFLSRSPQLLIPLLAIAIGYAILGHTLADMYRAHIFDLWQAVLIWLGVIVLGAVAIPVGLGGIIAALAAVIIIFTKLGWGAALLGAVITVVIMWLGLQETDPKEEQAGLVTIQWYEYAGVVLMVAVAVLLTNAVFRQFVGTVATILTGAIGGAIVVIGPQIRDLGIPPSDRLKLMGITMGTGFLIGLVHGLITYRFVIPS
jgi:hypothetical protein